MKVVCQIYRSKREEGMYLYCRKEDGLEKVPEPLRKRFGIAEPAMVLLLDGSRPLARVDVNKVMASLDDAGYYLQLPPRPESDFQVNNIQQHNSKL
ncbi:YcgL domain-containing protein [Gilvimarinus polysaccharolyticus]|uniref:YcgL domain-containing protein n=1 Tax=Gilvimarinus polysaccharolyticus TaxID=863921 RepID=UPI000673B1B6|nr:YcgL domain-containing protein [Gilvimarinus polysaccharolyticus]